MMELFGAEIISCKVSEVKETIDGELSRLTKEGYKPYFIEGRILAYTCTLNKSDQPWLNQLSQRSGHGQRRRSCGFTSAIRS